MLVLVIGGVTVCYLSCFSSIYQKYSYCTNTAFVLMISAGTAGAE